MKRPVYGKNFITDGLPIITWYVEENDKKQQDVSLFNKWIDFFLEIVYN